MSGGGGDTKTTSQQELAPEQQKILDLVMPTLTKTMKQGATPYPGQRVASFSPMEQKGRHMTAGAATGAMQDVATGAAGAQQFLSSGDVLDPRRNPGLAGAIEAGVDPLRSEFLHTIMPSIRGDAILSGAYGGSEQAESTGLASEALMRQVGNTTANIVNPAYQSGLDAYTRGLALAPQTAALQLGPGQALAGVGAQKRSLEQAQMDAAMQKWIEKQYGDLLLAEEIASVAFGMPLGTGVTSAQGGGGNPLMSGLGGAAVGAGIGSAIAPGPGTAIGAGLGGLLAFL